MVTPGQVSRVKVTVVYAVGGAGFMKEMLVPGYQTVGWAVNASGVVALHSALAGGFAVGVNGKVVALDTVVAEGMRIEVYVPVKKEALLAARKRPGGLQEAVE